MPNPRGKILTSFQEDLLRYLAGSPVGKRFFLTGGTALAARYLQHRLSEDLDLFSEEPGAVLHAAPVLETLPAKLGATVKIARQFASFLEAFITSPAGETVKIDFAEDSPYRLKPIEESPWGIRIDNALDISCNKLAALFGRAEAKDFIDIYFVVQRLFPFETLLPESRKKHVGMDDYWLAVSFQQVESIEKWPKLLVPCDLEALRKFFLDQARELMKGLQS